MITVYFRKKRTVISVNFNYSKKRRMDNYSEMEDSVEAVLKHFNLDSLQSKFAEFGAKVSDLKMLTLEDISAFAETPLDRIRMRTMITALASGSQASSLQHSVPATPLPATPLPAFSRKLLNDDTAPAPSTSELFKELDVSELFNGNTSGLVQDECVYEIVYQFDLAQKEPGAHLRRLLNLSGFGQKILLSGKKKLNQSETTHVSTTIVDCEHKYQKKIKNKEKVQIAGERWLFWANEVAAVFSEECSGTWYSPYSMVASHVTQASGILHCRWGNTSSREKGRRGSSDSEKYSSTSSESASPRNTPRNKQVRRKLTPSASSPPTQEDVLDLQLSQEESLEWLKVSTSPREMAESAWRLCHSQRMKMLESLTAEKYCDHFQVLNLEDGFVFLQSDFKRQFPDKCNVFQQQFPLFRNKVIGLLVEKSIDLGSSYPDVTEQFNRGGENADIAAIRAIPLIFRKIPPVSFGRKGAKAVSKVEFRNFIGIVPSAANLQDYYVSRAKLFHDRGFPLQPYLVAVGPSWEELSQVIFWVTDRVQYKFVSLTTALEAAFHIYWALQLRYSVDVAPCWMVVQRALFMLNSDFDQLGSPTREVIDQLLGETDSSGKRKRKPKLVTDM